METSQLATILPRRRMNIKAKNLFDIIFRVAKELNAVLEVSGIDATISFMPPYRPVEYKDGITLVKVKETIVRLETDADGDVGIPSRRGCTSSTIFMQPITEELTDLTIIRYDPPHDPAIRLPDGTCRIPNEFDDIEKGECPVGIYVFRGDKFDRAQFLNEFAKRILDEAQGVDLATRRKMLFGLLLYLLIVVVLFVPTLLVFLGVVPWQDALLLYVIGLAMERAAAWLGAWNNIFSLVEKLVNRR